MDWEWVGEHGREKEQMVQVSWPVQVSCRPVTEQAGSGGGQSRGEVWS